MANTEHLEVLKKGVETWNKIIANSFIVPDLSNGVFVHQNFAGILLDQAQLSEANFFSSNLSNGSLTHAVLFKANFSKTNLIGANISGAKLSDSIFTGANLTNSKLIKSKLAGADLSGAKLVNANLSGAQLMRVNLSGADLTSAKLAGADLSGAKLVNANLSGAQLMRVNLSGADLTSAKLAGADLSGAKLVRTTLNGANLSRANFDKCVFGGLLINNSDLSDANGLENVVHFAPSSLGIDTLYQSKGRIPDLFLRGCGVPEDFISYIPSLTGAGQVIQFYSCFISYSTKDEEFAKRLHARMQAEKLRVWFAPEDIKGGVKIHEQIETAIQIHDRLLLVLSENSMKSKWVVNEIRRARETEEREGRRKLFPIRLVDYKNIEEWKQMTSTGEDVAEEIRSYFIPDFTGWKDHDSFEKSFSRLLRDLRAEEKRNTKSDAST